VEKEAVGFDGRSITYRVSADDWGAAMVQLRRRSRGAWLLWFLPVAFGLLGIIDLASGDLLGAGLIVGALFMAAFAFSARFNGRLIQGQIGRFIGQMTTLTVTDDGLSYSGGPTTGTLDWSGVYDVTVGPQVVVVSRGRLISWAIIPRSAFASDREIDQFLAAVEAGRNNARVT
jgi:hypothetical protein